MYKAFISYSHAADNKLAPALQSALQSFAKPFYRLRAMRIFRDETSLHLTPELWPMIQQSLAQSEYFILMASPDAADSEWVQREINEWLNLSRTSVSKFNIVLTEGEIVWDPGTNDFDWEKTTALPASLKGVFNTEPLYLDFRWARQSEHLSLRNPQFLRAVGKLAAVLHDKPLDSIIGDDVRQHQIFKVVTSAVVVVLLALVVSVSVAAYIANNRTEQALAAVASERQSAEIARLATATAQSERATAELARNNEKDARDLAETRRQDAENQTVIAIEQRKEAIKQRGRAEQQTNIANEQRQEAVKQRDEALRSQSLFLADLANQQTSAGETRYGILLSLQALPRDVKTPDRPFVPQAEAALYRALTLPRQINVFDGHQERVWHATFVPGGRRIASSSLDRTVKLWDFESDKATTLRNEADLYEAIKHVAFNSDGTKLITSSLRRVRLWDTTTGAELANLSSDDTYDGRIVESSFSNNDRTVTTICNGRVRVWDSATGKEIDLAASLQTSDTPFAINPNHTRLLTTSKQGIARLWDLKKGTELARIGNDTYRVTFAKFSPDGKHLVTYNSHEGGRLRLWNGDTGKKVARLDGHDGQVDAYFSPKGQRLVTHGWSSAHGSGLRYRDLPRLWDSKGELIKTLEGHAGPVKHVAFSSDDQLLATASIDGTVRIWRTWDGTPVAVLRGHEGEVGYVEFSADGSHVLSTSTDRTVRLWAISDVNLLATLKAKDGRFNHASIDLQANRLMGSYDDGKIVLWDSNNWSVVNSMHDHKSRVLKTTWNSDHTSFVTGAADGSVYLWDAKTGARLASYEGHKGFIRTINFDFSNSRLISGGADGTARVWDLKTGSPLAVLQAEKEDVGHAYFLKDSKHVVTLSLSIPSRRILRLWNISDRVPIETHQGALSWTKPEPDRNMLVALYSNNKTIRILDVDQRREVSRLQGNFSTNDLNVTASAFSVDRQYLALGFANGAVYVWEVASGLEVGHIRGHERSDFEGSIKQISFSPDGKYLATGSIDKTAALWDIRTGERISQFPAHDDWVTQIVFDPEGKHLVTMGGGVRLWDSFSGELLFSIPKSKLGSIFDYVLDEGGKVLTVIESEEISVRSLFPSNEVRAFPTTSALLDFAKGIPLTPLTNEERKRFFIPLN